MLQYHNLLETILATGNSQPPARPNMPGTKALFGFQQLHNLSLGFPLVTTKKVPFKSIITELLWIMKGRTDLRYLIDNGCNVWNDDAFRYYSQRVKQLGITTKLSKEEFVNLVKTEDIFGDCVELGKVYGKQWRNFNGQDQLLDLIEGIKENPFGRRHIITAWNPAEIEDMALPACHAFVQFHLRKTSIYKKLALYRMKYGQEFPNPESEFIDQILLIEGIPTHTIDCLMYQRSADAFLGVPFNIASYAALTHFIGLVVDATPGHFIHTFGDVHIYDNHVNQVETILLRNPYKYKLPQLNIEGVFNLSMDVFGALPHNLDRDQVCHLISLLEPSNFVIENYQSYPAIKADLSVGL